MRSGVFIFFLFLCLQVVSGKSYVDGQSQDRLLHTTGITIAHQLNNVQLTSDNPIFKNEDLPDETQLISVDDDDDDFINRKHLLFSRYVLAFSDVYILLHQEHVLLRRSEFFSPCLFFGSPRYIVHRVIKI